MHARAPAGDADVAVQDLEHVPGTQPVLVQAGHVQRARAVERQVAHGEDAGLELGGGAVVAGIAQRALGTGQERDDDLVRRVDPDGGAVRGGDRHAVEKEVHGLLRRVYPQRAVEPAGEDVAAALVDPAFAVVPGQVERGRAGAVVGSVGGGDGKAGQALRQRRLRERDGRRPGALCVARARINRGSAPAEREHGAQREQEQQPCGASAPYRITGC